MLKEIEKKVENGLPEGIELVDLQFSTNGRKVLRVFIDKDGGINLDTCSVVSSILGVLIEEEGLIRGNYLLEVSSPGLERVLKKPSDFKKFVGRDVKVKLISDLSGRRRFKGKLLEASPESFKILLEGGESVEIAYSNVSKANLIWKYGGGSDEL